MKTIVMTLSLAALLLAAGAVAFIYSGVYDVSASTPHGAVSSWVMETTMHSSIERRASQVEVPDLGDESLVLEGVNDFEEMCVQCHGAPGKKPAAVGEGLNPPAPDLAESANEMTAAELFWVTKHGVKMTGMPAWGRTHEDDALWPVVALMSALPELDAAAYDDLLNRAEGMGHHAGDAAENGHAHGADKQNQAPHDDGESTDAEESEEAEHDHNAHEH
jgi:mono/diheme cytochrome c family protein